MIGGFGGRGEEIRMPTKYGIPRIFVDGKQMEDVVSASCERGIVWIYEHDRDGNRIRDYAGREGEHDGYALVRVKGKVEMRYV